MKTKLPKDMTDSEFERYLKRYKLTGMGAVVASRKRRLAIQAKQSQSVSPYPSVLNLAGWGGVM